MSIAKGDYIVVEAGKNVLLKVREVDGKNITGINQQMKRNSEGVYEKRLPLTVKSSQVLVNLGKTPRPGKVYGVNIEPLYKRVDTNTCGQLLFFVDMDDKQTTRVKKALIRTYKKLAERKLGGVPAQIEIRPVQGKYAGWYKFLPKAEADVLCLKPNLEMSDDKDLTYLIAHEYAHGVWFRMMTRGNIARWIALYDKHMAQSTWEDADLEDIKNESIASEGIRNYLREAEEELRPVIRAVLRSIKSLHGVDAKHLDTLIRQGHSIDEYWPTQVQFADRNVIISEYAMKSPEEFFAEAFSFWFIGKSLPKEVQKLLDRSLSQLAKHQVNGDEEVTTTSDED